MPYDVLVVGAGFSGAVCAQRLAEAGSRVLVIDKRDHIGGNCHDAYDANGVLIHPYGPHIFHTNSKRVFDYLSHFTAWRPYEHRVRAKVRGQLYPVPINRTTINQLYGLKLKEDEVQAYLDSVRVPLEHIATSEDAVLSSVGRELCDLFFRGYTRKQWGLDLSQLSANVAGRVKVRTSDDDRYFLDSFQFMPDPGFDALFRRLLDSPRIDVQLCTDFAQLSKTDFPRIIYTGRIDTFFDCRFGELPYRSLKFEHEHIAGREWFQEVPVVNYPCDETFTRITEFKYLTGQTHSGTSIVREYPQAEGEPYYPIPRPQNEELYQKYRALAAGTKNVSFVGRLAEYRYYNMDQVVGAALALIDKLRPE